MKKYFRSVILLFTLLLALCVSPQFVRAAGPPDGEPPDGGATDPDAPIDGGICILVAVGVGYGIKKIVDEKNKNLSKIS